MAKRCNELVAFTTASWSQGVGFLQADKKDLFDTPTLLCIIELACQMNPKLANCIYYWVIHIYCTQRQKNAT
jgi:hypothetical protein